MEPELYPPPPENSNAEPAPETAPETSLAAEIFAPPKESLGMRAIRWTLFGGEGLRAGWSFLIFVLLMIVFAAPVGFVFVKTHLLIPGNRSDFTPSAAFFSELTNFLPLIGALALMALIERRRSLLVYNLTEPRSIPHFFSGLVMGFLSLSALVGALVWGGWLHFGPVALSGVPIYQFAALWLLVFLTVGCVEEGIFRCYMLFTLTRGINFWWALGTVGSICVWLVARSKGNGVWGVYGIALLGLLPCLWLHLKKAEGAGFWQATWVTSTLFGFIHTGNGGENWIGIFAAGFVGVVFCVSVRVTGSAWWAIGCHAAWDWAQTYFYGTADSGMTATGHYMTCSPAGKIFWSGGADGPEGSVLVIGALLLMLAVLLAVYGRKKPVVATLERAIG
ncbi:MAG: CPBP family intramembrane glutamic endopeptidase [Terracidiphilus sp.]|jgi:membrane protease YdiL (CAAX protease family)